MIIVTKLNNSRFAVNPDLVERIHSNPDTTLTLVDGSTYIVTESMEQVIDLMARYRARVIALARMVESDDLRDFDPDEHRYSGGELVLFPDPIPGTASLAPAPRPAQEL